MRAPRAIAPGPPLSQSVCSSCSRARTTCPPSTNSCCGADVLAAASALCAGQSPQLLMVETVQQMRVYDTIESGAAAPAVSQALSLQVSPQKALLTEGHLSQDLMWT